MTEALRLAAALENGPHGTQVEQQAAALLRTQHAALERKDALLRQALEALTYHTEQTRPIQQTIDAKLALEQELAK